MPIIDDVFNLLVLHEGLRLKPYKCTAGKLTIGVGRNIEDNGITKEEAEHLLTNDIARVKIELAANFPWTRDIRYPRRAVYIDMLFAMGLPKFKTFVKMHAAAEKGEWETAASELENSKWANQVGTRAARLAHMMEFGEWV